MILIESALWNFLLQLNYMFIYLKNKDNSNHVNILLPAYSY